jgi:small-conductance mechanosensitive channel
MSLFQSTNPADATTTAAINLASFFYGNWPKLLLTIAILAIALIVIRFLKSAIAQLGRDNRLPPGTIRAINVIVTYGTMIIAVVNVLAVFNIQLYSLIVSLGVISAVVVLSSQMIISNLLGGVVVYVERPFVMGDAIRVGDNYGVVEGMNIRSTTLKGDNGLAITVPNSTFLTNAITNYTRTHRYLIKVPFTMPRDVNLSGLAEAMRAHATSIPGFIPEETEALYKTGVSKDDFQCELHFWVSDPGYRRHQPVLRVPGGARQVIRMLPPEDPPPESKLFICSP